MSAAENDAMTLLYIAWTLTSNVGAKDGSGWAGQGEEWWDAAIDFREKYHNLLNATQKVSVR